MSSEALFAIERPKLLPNSCIRPKRQHWPPGKRTVPKDTSSSTTQPRFDFSTAEGISIEGPVHHAVFPMSVLGSKKPGMANSSSIEWTESTWNPTTGCDRTSPGCDHCYALTLAKRLKGMGQAKYQSDGDPRTSGPGFGLTLHPDVLQLPYLWRKPRLVFVNSMSDLFHQRVPNDFIQDVFSIMADNAQHTFQILTKRSHRLKSLGAHLNWSSNVWMGVSIESDPYVFRAAHLREVPATVRFLSIEPMLGPITNLDLEGIHWVIVGGESGPRCPTDGHQLGSGTSRSVRRFGGPVFLQAMGRSDSKIGWSRA